MSDPLRTDDLRALEAASDADRTAKIEQLLLVGLDHYFAAQYDQAINVWTRALFFDRSHPRARAYIERARSALAERQRESEELLQHGGATRGARDVRADIPAGCADGGAAGDRRRRRDRCRLVEPSERRLAIVHPVAGCARGVGGRAGLTRRVAPAAAPRRNRSRPRAL